MNHSYNSKQVATVESTEWIEYCIRIAQVHLQQQIQKYEPVDDASEFRLNSQQVSAILGITIPYEQGQRYTISPHDIRIQAVHSKKHGKRVTITFNVAVYSQFPQKKEWHTCTVEAYVTENEYKIITGNSKKTIATTAAIIGACSYLLYEILQ